jgi:lactoylglutathione lyase
MVEPRLVGVGLHVDDLERSVAFYTTVLGMQVVARYEFEGLTEVLVGYGAQGESPSVVLVDRADHGPVDAGTGFDRLLVIVDDIQEVLDRLRAFGCEVTKEPGAPTEFPAMLAMAKDPDGYGLELIQPRDQ